MADYKSGYHDITALYGYADELVSTVEDRATADPQLQLELVEPLINEVASAADILADEFIMVAESKRSHMVNKSSKKRIETALRRLFVVVHEYQEKVANRAENIATVIVGKIQQQIDKIVVVFLEFVQISLHSIMNKAELEAAKARDTRIAVMMHQLSLSHNGG